MVDRSERFSLESYRSAFNYVLLQDHSVCNRGIGEDNEAKAPGAACGSIPHDDGVRDGAIAAEVLSQRLLRRLPRDAAHEDLPHIRIHGVFPVAHRADKSETMTRNLLFLSISLFNLQSRPCALAGEERAAQKGRHTER